MLRWLRGLAPFLLGVIALSLFGAMALRFNWWEMLRGGYGWRWGYAVPTIYREWVPTLLGILVYLIGVVWLMRRQSPRWMVLGWGFLGAAILPFVFLTRWTDDPTYELYTRIASGASSGPHQIANDYTDKSLYDALQNWTDEQQRFVTEVGAIHPALAPPGLPLLYYGGTQILEKMPVIANPLGRRFRQMQCHDLGFAEESNAELASAAVGMMAPVWSALAVFPLFWLGKKMTDENGARWMVLLWALIPGIAAFTPIPNVIFPTLALICIASLWAGLLQRSYSWAFGAGLVAFIITFLNFSLIPLLMLCGWLALGYHVTIGNYDNNPPSRWWSLKIGLVFGLGLFAPWFLWMAWGGDPPWAMLQTAMTQHFELDRPYFAWVVLHLWDYALFLGLPLALLGGLEFFKASRTLYQTRGLSPMFLLALSLGLTLIILTLSGMARGETGRVWAFFFPFSLIVAVGMVYQLSAINQWALIVTQVIFALVILLFVPVINTNLAHPPQEPPLIENPRITTDTNIRFGEHIRLTGFGGTLDTDQNVVVDLRWVADEISEEPYWLYIVSDNEPHQSDMLFQPVYPITCWQVGQTIVERVKIPLDTQSEEIPNKDDWRLSIRVLDYHTAEPLRVIDAEGATDTQAQLHLTDID